MNIYFMDADELHALIQNARWFVGYWVLSSALGGGRFRVKTNYPWIQGEL